MNGIALALALFTQAEILRLGHDDWGQRESAQRNLETLMPVIDQTMGAVSGDPERVCRARRIRDNWQASVDSWYWTRANNLRAPGFNLTPWIDSFREEDRATIDYFLERARAHPDYAKLPQRTYEDYRLATILWADGELKRGVTEAELVQRFARAAEYETAWLKGNARPDSVWEEMLREATAEKIAGPK